MLPIFFNKVLKLNINNLFWDWLENVSACMTFSARRRIALDSTASQFS